jgi:hypothetical protein
MFIMLVALAVGYPVVVVRTVRRMARAPRSASVWILWATAVAGTGIALMVGIAAARLALA